MFCRDRNPFSRLLADRSGASIPRFGKPGIQGELSLDKVKVVRSDLAHADLEVVPVGSGGNRAASPAWRNLTDADFWRGALNESLGKPDATVPNFEHKPVMMAEVLAALRPKPGGRYVDGTLGGAGHAAAILAASSPTGWLSGCDRDGVALEAATVRLAEFAGRFEIRRGNFAELAEWIPAGSCDGVLLDLGVSSPQLDVAERGFSFQQDGPLDMRMDVRQPLTAAELVNTAGAEELAKIFWEYGDERDSRRFARAIVHDREQCRVHHDAAIGGIDRAVVAAPRAEGASGHAGVPGVADRGE